MPVGVYMIITKCFKKEKHNDRIKICLNTKVAPIHFGLKESNQQNLIKFSTARRNTK